MHGFAAGLSSAGADFLAKFTRATSVDKSLVYDNGTTAGNVGIGTTSPAQKLHVEGQCVTGDTLILARPTPTSGPAVEETPIVDLKAGDLVMSLNEAAGRIEPHRVNGLLYMGVKPVFRLKTASGRQVKTTGNHPYLTRSGWKKVVELRVGEEIAVPGPAAFQDIASNSSAPTISSLPANSWGEVIREKSFVKACWMRPNSRGSILSQIIPGLLEGGYIWVLEKLGPLSSGRELGRRRRSHLPENACRLAVLAVW